jgi:hypothetical protein
MVDLLCDSLAMPLKEVSACILVNNVAAVTPTCCLQVNVFSVHGFAHAMRCGRNPFVCAHHAAGADVSWSDLGQRMVKQVKSAGQGTAAAAAAAYVRGGLTVCPDGALTPDVRARMMSSICTAAGCASDALAWSEGVDVGGGRGGSGGHLQRRSMSLFTPHPRAHSMLRQAAQRVLQLVEVGAYVHWYAPAPHVTQPAPSFATSSTFLIFDELQVRAVGLRAGRDR